MKPISVIILLWAGLGLGCATPTPPVPITDTNARVELAEPSSIAPRITISNGDEQLLRTLISDLRSQDYRNPSHLVGICRKLNLACTELPTQATQSLSPGEYIIYARLAVPEAIQGQTWTVQFTTTCSTQNLDTTTPEVTKNTRTYAIELIEPIDHLMPLEQITSPLPDGATQQCDYSVIIRDPNGDNREVDGSWQIPSPKLAADIP